MSDQRAYGRGPVVALALAGLLVALVVAALWFESLVRAAGRGDAGLLNPDDAPYVLAMVTAGTVGALLAVRVPRNPAGWLLLALALTLATEALAQVYAVYGLFVAPPGAVPGALWAALLADVTWLVDALLIGFLLAVTPGGSLPSPRWRPWAVTSVVAAVVALAVRPGGMDPPFDAVPSPLTAQGPVLAVLSNLAVVVTLLAVPAGALALVTRFRRARGIERLQLRWVALAAVLAALAVAVVILSWALGVGPLVWGWVTGLYVAALPLAVGAAVLRYRLFDLDRIISRTVTYGLMTVLLAGAYALLVLGLSQLVGRGSPLAVAGATLLVAAAFQPTRRRVQAAVDRRFNRRRYDAARTIAAFSARLRQQIGLDVLTTQLAAVVEETMQPATVSLWLRPDPD